jgi:spore coat protein U-like protein
MLAAASPAGAVTSCSVSAIGGLAFGTIDILSGMAVDVTGGSIQVNCTGTDGAVPYTIALDAGSGPGASVSVRQMQSASATLAYSIYQSMGDRGANAPWGTSGGGALSTSLTIGGGTGTNSSPVYGRVFGGQQTASPGATSSGSADFSRAASSRRSWWRRMYFCAAFRATPWRDGRGRPRCCDWGAPRRPPTPSPMARFRPAMPRRLVSSAWPCFSAASWSGRLKP